jgi:hypothetical protein
VITIPCPNGCGPVEANAFRNHMKWCKPKAQPAEKPDVADDLDLHPRTAYEQRITCPKCQQPHRGPRAPSCSTTRACA